MSDPKFSCGDADLAGVLSLFGIFTPILCSETLQSYDYDENESDNYQHCIRLIIKATLADGHMLVARLMMGECPDEVINAQWAFSQLLRENGILTPLRYACGGKYIARIVIDGMSLTASVEDFAVGEIKTVDEVIQYSTGVALAKTHNIAEKFDTHVNNAIIFDPLGRDDITDFDGFIELRDKLPPSSLPLYEVVLTAYEQRRASLLPIKSRPVYAVQGDLSNPNLYYMDGQVGLFDFNNCGDSVLLCDAVMQAVFTSRLMDYAEPVTPALSDSLFRAFMRGYNSLRPLTGEDRRYASDIYALEASMWANDVSCGDSSMKKSLERGEDVSDRLAGAFAALERGYDFGFLY